MSTPAREFYIVAGEDRPLSPLRRTARWALTIVGGLVGDSDGPAVTDVVIRRRHDGTEVARLSPDMLTDVEGTLTAIGADLESMDADAFATAWVKP